MKKTLILYGWAGLALLFFSTSCSSPKQGRAALPSPDTPMRAGALAEYSMALREGLAGNEEEAIERYRAAIAADPDNIDLRLELAVIFLHDGRYVEMDEEIDRALSIDPDYIRALRLKSFGNRMRGRLAEALPPLERAIQLEPQELGHYIEAATIQGRRGNTAEAVEVLESAISAVTNRLEALENLARLHVEIAARERRAEKPLDPSGLSRVAAAVEEFPNEPGLLALYGDLLALHQKMEEAIEVFARIEEMNPQDPNLRQKLAMSLVAVGEPAKAIELLEDAAKKQPDNFRLKLYLAELHQRENNPDAAIENYRAAIQLRPEITEIYLQLASLLIARNRIDEAVEITNLARERNPDDHRAIEIQAYIFFRQRDYAKSAGLFDEAESLFTTHTSRPVLTRFHAIAAVANQMITNQPGAIRLLRAGVKANPDVIRQYMAMALRAREGSERLTSSIELLEAAPDLLPRDASTSTLLGLLNMRAEKFGAAIAHLEEAERLAMEAGDEEETLNSQFYFWLGSACERNKDFDRAEEYFLKAIDLQPDYADAHNYLAYMNAERGVKLEAAYDHVGVALAVEPDNAAYIDTRGWIYYKQGKYQEALVDIQRAVELLPDDPTITDHLGDIHLALGNESEALVWWKKSYALDPENELVKEKLTTRGVNLTEISIQPAPEEEHEDLEQELEPDAEEEIE